MRKYDAVVGMQALCGVNRKRRMHSALLLGRAPSRSSGHGTHGSALCISNLCYTASRESVQRSSIRGCLDRCTAVHMDLTVYEVIDQIARNGGKR